MDDSKVWFITGAGRGMGVAIAEAAIAAGHVRHRGSSDRKAALTSSVLAAQLFFPSIVMAYEP